MSLTPLALSASIRTLNEPFWGSLAIVSVLMFAARLCEVGTLLMKTWTSTTRPWGRRSLKVNLRLSMHLRLEGKPRGLPFGPMVDGVDGVDGIAPVPAGGGASGGPPGGGAGGRGGGG